MQDIMQIRKEILEHTIDCDYNRNLHFNEYNHYSKVSRLLNAGQMISLILIILIYSVFYEIGIEKTWINLTVIGLSVVATTLQLIDYFWSFSSLAQQHWLAAQAYSRLYRQCQFFPSHYGVNCDKTIAREAAKNICNELFDLNLMSPNLSRRNFSKVAAELKGKKYPIHSEIFGCKSHQLSPVVETIKAKFNQYQMEVICFGSYIRSLHNNDIDIAVIIYSDNANESALNNIILEIEKHFRQEGLKIDLTLMMQSTLHLQSQIPFIRNIKRGECLYASPELNTSILQHSCDCGSLKDLIDKHYEKVLVSFKTGDESDIINKSYYYIRNLIVYTLTQEQEEWNSEDEMIDRLIAVAERNSDLAPMEELYFKLRKLKNIEFSIGIDKNIPSETINNIVSTIKTIHSSIQCQCRQYTSPTKLACVE